MGRLIFLLAGAVLIAAPVLREFDPGNLILGNFSLVQFLAAELFLALIAYWSREAWRAETRRSQLGCMAVAGVALACALWIIQYLGTDALVFLDATPTLIGVGVATILLVLWTGIYTGGGRNLVLIVVAALAIGYLGQYLSVDFVPEIGFATFVTYLVYGSDGVFGLPLDIIINTVFVFIMFGVAFDVAGGAEVIMTIAQRLARHSSAAAIKTCVIASGMFGTVSGAALSNVMTTGAFTIPGMRRVGVKAETAAGIEAAASSCGMIMPPVLGATAFFLADFAGVPYGRILLASIAPALLCYYAFFRQADLVVVEVPEALDVEIARLRPAHSLYLVPPAGMVALMMQSTAYLTFAGILGVTLCLMVSFILQGPRMTLRRAWRALPRLIQTCTTLVITVGLIGLLLGALYSTGLAISWAIAISSFGSGNLALALVLTAAICFVLGMGVASVGVYVVAATLLVPGLIDLGVPHIAAHFFVLYCSLLSLITPPVAFASLAASTLAQSDFSGTTREAMKFGWVLFVLPFLVVLQPGLLFIGTWVDFARAVVICTVFVTLATDCRLDRRLRLGLVVVSVVAIAAPVAHWGMAALSMALASPLLFRCELLAGRRSPAMRFQTMFPSRIAAAPARLRLFGARWRQSRSNGRLDQSGRRD